MTTDKRNAANKANAQKSTGPVSAKGKAAASQNAKTHGLTSPPDWRRVISWFRIIMADPTVVPDPLSTDAVARAAHVLAEAEASRERAAQVEENHLKEMSDIALRGRERSLEELDELNLDDMETLEYMMRQAEDPDLRSALRLIKDVSPKRPAALHETRQRLRRYRREAEARRRKALADWIEFVG